MKRVDFDDYTVPEASQQPADTSGPKWGLLFLVAIVAVAAIVFLRQPISDSARSYAAKAEQDRDERKRQAEREALERAVRPRITMVDDKLNQLESDIHEMAVQFETVTEVPLDRMHETATRKIDYMILESDTFVTAWNQLREARISSEDLDPCKKTLSDIRYSLQTGSLDPLNVTQLDELLTWIAGQNRLIETQRNCLKTIENELNQKSSP